MPLLEKTLTIGDVSRPLYTLAVSDSDPNAEFRDFEFQFFPASFNGISAANVEAAIQAFADSIVGSHPTFVQGPISKTICTTTTI